MTPARSSTGLLVTTLVAGLVLAGCGSGSDAATPTTSPTTSATTSAPTSPATSTTDATATGTSDDASQSSTSASASTTRPTSTASPRPTTASTKEFVAVVRGRVPEVARGRTDAEIGLIAVAACAGLRSGLDADLLVAGARSLGTLDAEATDEATARELIKLAIDTVCLDQARRVDEF